MSADFAFLNIFTADGLLDDNDMSPKGFDLRVQEIAYEDAIILNSDAWYRYIGTDIGRDHVAMDNRSEWCKILYGQMK